MSFSRIAGILSGISAAAAAGATYLGELNPRYVVVAMALSVIVSSFTERIQGGLSTHDEFILSDDERAIIEIHRIKERQK